MHYERESSFYNIVALKLAKIKPSLSGTLTSLPPLLVSNFLRRPKEWKQVVGFLIAGTFH